MSQIIDLRKKKTKSKKPNKIEWTTSEFAKHKKEKSWFVLPTFIAIIIIIIAILIKNPLLVVITVLAIFTVYIYAKKEPRKIKFSISGKGIQVDKNIYRFDDLKSFWIFYELPEIKELSLRSKKMLTPYIKIPLDNQNPVEIRKFLLRFLLERKHKESIIEILMRKTRF